MTAPATTLDVPAGSFQALLESAWNGALRWAWRLTGDEADAEDLRQDAALRALKGWGTFRQESNFTAWFNQIILNCHRDAIRRSGRRPATVIIAEDALDLEPLTGKEPDPAERTIGRIRYEEVRDALGRLPAAFRDAAVLYYLEDRPYHEIARALDCPVGTVRSRLSRARALLQLDLADVA